MLTAYAAFFVVLGLTAYDTHASTTPSIGFHGGSLLLLSEPGPLDLPALEVPALLLAAKDRAATEKRAARLWYGYAILAADGVVALLNVSSQFAYGQRSNDMGEGLLTAGLGVHLLGGPVIHVYHGRPGRAALSVLTRVVVPILGAMLGAAMTYDNSGQGDDPGLDGMITGLQIGMAISACFDAFVFGWDE